MFNLFKKKGDSVKVIDKIWMTQQGKWKGIVELWKTNPEIFILTWFDETWQRLNTLFANETSSNISLYRVKEVHHSQIGNATIIFAEHHPLREREQEIFKQLQLREAIVHSALDEPLFLHFGGEKVMGLMKQLGMDENNMIEHKMISHAIENAQEKIEKKLVSEHMAASQREWMERNL
jgi:hypothetical protein